MSKTNHQRNYHGQKDSQRYHYSPIGGTMKISEFADVIVGASWGGDNSNGHIGYGRVKRGGKKFVRSRIRFQENQFLKTKVDYETC
jgi:hypothetical protein